MFDFYYKTIMYRFCTKYFAKLYYFYIKRKKREKYLRKIMLYNMFLIFINYIFSHIYQ